MNNINSIIRDVVRIILRHAKPERIYLYGSYAEGEAGQGSDIDVAYEDGDFSDHYLIEEEIEALKTLVKIDVHNIAAAEKRFRERVKATGKVLYSATKKLRAEDGLHNFSRALEKFADSVDRKEELIEAGFGDVFLDLVVKRFEFTYEMSWKALKRHLSFLGIEAANPRAVFKEAYAQGIIADEKVWLDMIEQRNLSAHIYDEMEIRGILDRVEAYKNAFLLLKKRIEAEME